MAYYIPPSEKVGDTSPTKFRPWPKQQCCDPNRRLLAQQEFLLNQFFVPTADVPTADATNSVLYVDKPGYTTVRMAK